MIALFNSGGILILEAQGFESYEKKKKLTSKILENFQSLQLLPSQFTDFLLHEVGFSSAQVVGIPRHQSKGFQRPIQVKKQPLKSMENFGKKSITFYLFPGFFKNASFEYTIPRWHLQYPIYTQLFFQ